MIHTTSANQEQLAVEIIGSPVEILYELTCTLIGVKKKMLIGKMNMTEEEANAVMTKVFFQAMTMDDNGKVDDRDGDKD